MTTSQRDPSPTSSESRAKHRRWTFFGMAWGALEVATTALGSHGGIRSSLTPVSILLGPVGLGLPLHPVALRVAYT